jgi:ABC-type polysaccharide/polyol phosphate transport system ATPase subunit
LFDSDAAAVTVENLTVTYRTVLERRPTLRKALVRLGRRERSTRTVRAVDDVSFSVPRGSVLAVIGRNGAGKSTLLRAVGGIIPPTSGRVSVRGEVTTMLALGVGFNRELTGRDNIELGVLAAGMPPEIIDEKFGEIADFAELGEFIDYPLRTYSSGMASRLAFSVAIHLDPEIILIDEALAAGDSAFKQKCSERVKDLCAADRTALLVTHGLRTVKELATDCIWMHQGRVVGRGEPEEVVGEYMAFTKVKESNAAAMEDV